MVGLLLLYFVGKAFYALSERHNRSKWGFAILGVGSYYLGTFIGGFVVAILYEVVLEQSIDDMNDMLLGLMALPFGVLACWGFYKILEKTVVQAIKFFCSRRCVGCQSD